MLPTLLPINPTNFSFSTRTLLLATRRLTGVPSVPTYSPDKFQVFNIPCFVVRSGTPNLPTLLPTSPTNFKNQTTHHVPHWHGHCRQKLLIISFNNPKLPVRGLALIANAMPSKTTRGSTSPRHSDICLWHSHVNNPLASFQAHHNAFPFLPTEDETAYPKRHIARTVFDFDLIPVNHFSSLSGVAPRRSWKPAHA